jgi:toxin ParE1/3/4
VTRVRLSSAAERDVLAAKDWYAHQGPGLDLSFRDDLDRTLDQIRVHPAAYPIVHEKIRRANLRRFPYGIFYVVRTSHIFVLGIVHHARHPNHWKTRW